MITHTKEDYSIGVTNRNYASHNSYIRYYHSRGDFMRVTNQLLNYISQGGITRTSNKMLNAVEQGNTGLRINRPSDSPITYAIARQYDKQVQQNERYLENNAIANGWLERQSTSITEFKKVMDSSFVLLEQAANGITTNDELDIIAYELRQMMKQLVSVVNNNFNGDYIFGGIRFETPPYKEGIAVDSVIPGIQVTGNTDKTIIVEAPTGGVPIPNGNPQDFAIVNADGTKTTVTLPAGDTSLDLGNGVTLSFPTTTPPTVYDEETITIRPTVIYNGTQNPNDTFKIEIMEGQTIEVSGVGGLIFGGRVDTSSTNANMPLSQNTNAFEVLGKMIASIESHDRNAISNMLAPMKDSITHIVNYQATVGGRLNRLSIAEDMVTTSSSVAEDARSNVQDVNVLTLLEQTKALELQYQLSVSLFSRINAMNILNYL